MDLSDQKPLNVTSYSVAAGSLGETDDSEKNEAIWNISDMRNQLNAHHVKMEDQDIYI